MKIQTYADVYTSGHPLAAMQAAGFKKTGGHLLREVLSKTGGRYEVVAEMSDELRNSVLQYAASRGDAALQALASKNSVAISLEHMRGLDPDTTRIVYGLRLVKEATDSHLPGIEP